MDDSKIVALFLSRNESAIALTAQKYGPKLRRIANRILDNMESAQECENDTYLQAWNRIPPHEPWTYLFAFLGKIIRHLAIDECRRQTSQKRPGLFYELSQEMQDCIPAPNDVVAELEAEELSQVINAFLENFSPEQRDVFVRRYWFFDPISDIAQRYGFSRSKVKVMLFRMRQDLRIHLEKEGYTI